MCGITRWELLFPWYRMTLKVCWGDLRWNWSEFDTFSTKWGSKLRFFLSRDEYTFKFWVGFLMREVSLIRQYAFSVNNWTVAHSSISGRCKSGSTILCIHIFSLTRLLVAWSASTYNFNYLFQLLTEKTQPFASLTERWRRRECRCNHGSRRNRKCKLPTSSAASSQAARVTAFSGNLL